MQGQPEVIHPLHSSGIKISNTRALLNISSLHAMKTLNTM